MLCFEKISLLGKNAIFLENLILILYDEMCHDTNKYVKLRKLPRGNLCLKYVEETVKTGEIREISEKSRKIFGERHIK